MKKSVLKGLLLTSLMLVACGRSVPQKEVVETATSQSSQVQKKPSSASKNSKASSSIKSSSQGAKEGGSSTRSSAPVAPSVTKTENYFSVAGKYGEVIIVNKKHPLAPTYAPGENPEAKAAFDRLLTDMQAQGYAVSQQYSGFRSYEMQATIYQNYVARDGQAAADRYSARPGYSEHQTGLAFDVLDAAGRLLEEPAAASWLANQAHHYGFIVRYQPGKEMITGYMAESWHLRYIGQEAHDIYQSGLTLEEYYGVPGGGY